MCVDREKDGGGETMIGYLDAMNEVRAKVMPVLELMSLAGELNPNIEKPLTAEELGNLGWRLWRGF